MREREELARQALDASEAERRRIARDLHDGVVQDLAGVSYSLSALTRRGDGAAPEIAAAEGTVRASIAALRSLLVDLYPPDLAEIGLPSALSDLLSRAEDEGLSTALDATAFTDPVPVHLAQPLYRIAQEAVRNVVAHAGASRIDVTLSTGERCARLSVVDDGRGIGDGGPAAGAGHLGLQSMTDLARGVGGTVRVSGESGRGTTVLVEVPLP
jgi:signal transduction histidine kinase